MIYIFDKDQTLVAGITEANGRTRPPNTPEEQKLLPGVKRKIEKLQAEGCTVMICSNQGGVAWGFMTWPKADELMKHAAALIDADDYIFCPHHPKGNKKSFSIECNCRKPKPGMIDSLLGKHGGYNNRSVVHFIGDQVTDLEAALAAGLPEENFHWASDFFAEEAKYDLMLEQLLKALATFALPEKQIEHDFWSGVKGYTFNGSDILQARAALVEAYRAGLFPDYLEDQVKDIVGTAFLDGLKKPE
jgi:D-glycero-D-manno-heptose 1,7-bisphosphate phosphatase